MQDVEPLDEGSYEYVCCLGEGSYGSVLLCRERDTGRLVAVKGFKYAHTDKLGLRLALREMRVLKSLVHPLIIPLERAFRRDIKPSNVLIKTDGTIRLCDFGFARVAHSSSSARTTAAGGSCAEEQERLTSYVQTHVWAIGATIAEMALGHPVLPGSSSLDQLWRILGALPGPRPSAVVAAVEALQRLNPAQAGGGVTAEQLRPKELPGRPLREVLSGLEPGARQLLAACLQLEPSARPTTEELLRVPWFGDVRREMAGNPTLERLYDIEMAAGPAAAVVPAMPPSTLQALAAAAKPAAEADASESLFGCSPPVSGREAVPRAAGKGSAAACLSLEVGITSPGTPPAPRPPLQRMVSYKTDPLQRPGGELRTDAGVIRRAATTSTPAAPAAVPATAAAQAQATAAAAAQATLAAGRQAATVMHTPFGDPAAVAHVPPHTAHGQAPGDAADYGNCETMGLSGAVAAFRRRSGLAIAPPSPVYPSAADELPTPQQHRVTNYFLRRSSSTVMSDHLVSGDLRSQTLEPLPEVPERPRPPAAVFAAATVAAVKPVRAAGSYGKASPSASRRPSLPGARRIGAARPGLRRVTTYGTLNDPNLLAARQTQRRASGSPGVGVGISSGLAGGGRPPAAARAGLGLGLGLGYPHRQPIALRNAASYPCQLPPASELMGQGSEADGPAPSPFIPYFSKAGAAYFKGMATASNGAAVAQAFLHSGRLASSLGMSEMCMSVVASPKGLPAAATTTGADAAGGAPPAPPRRAGTLQKLLLYDEYGDRYGQAHGLHGANNDPGYDGLMCDSDLCSDCGDSDDGDESGQEGEEEGFMGMGWRRRRSNTATATTAGAAAASANSATASRRRGSVGSSRGTMLGYLNATQGGAVQVLSTLPLPAAVSAAVVAAAATQLPYTAATGGRGGSGGGAVPDVEAGLVRPLRHNLREEPVSPVLAASAAPRRTAPRDMDPIPGGADGRASRPQRVNVTPATEPFPSERFADAPATRPHMAPGRPLAPCDGTPPAPAALYDKYGASSGMYGSAYASAYGSTTYGSMEYVHAMDGLAKAGSDRSRVGRRTPPPGLWRDSPVCAPDADNTLEDVWADFGVSLKGHPARGSGAGRPGRARWNNALAPPLAKRLGGALLRVFACGGGGGGRSAVQVAESDEEEG
ncbi:hypothetical protein GPECTOR_16g653 [Gonium pectorale]|uniref:Protein kinase domain-containing protein n=1 Tax=Gonium pectorale TaxID=33097 RepID=A0A150GL20_GONPE|nr:hypothetical protein GPECTOR_16g653 [Gonium pectorale]|eukprot:KXZ50478.1 hypothetical protein GPECTOR_16g653 [Gonium pectorale]